MAETRVAIPLENCMGRLLDAVDSAVATWSEGDKDRFCEDWQALVAAGAEWCDVSFIGGRIVAWPSEDFTAHCAAWDIYPSEGTK